MKRMHSKILKNYLDNNDAILLLDVREPAEYRSEYIKSALLIPLGQLSREALPSYASSVPIIIYCHSGKRSENACLTLLAKDPNLDLYSLEGGITSWKQHNFSVIKNGPKRLPLDGQTLLVAGVLAFSGTVLGATIHPGFYSIPGFIGMGLMSAGLTGWCGMAKLLAKMPWNQ